MSLNQERQWAHRTEAAWDSLQAFLQSHISAAYLLTPEKDTYADVHLVREHL